MISRMAKPEEVIVVENDQGEVVREVMKDTDAINMYRTMRETLGTIYACVCSYILLLHCTCTASLFHTMYMYMYMDVLL